MSAKWGFDIRKDTRSVLRHFGFPVVGGVLIELINFAAQYPGVEFSWGAVKAAAVLGGSAAVLRFLDRWKADIQKWANPEEGKTDATV